MVVNCPAVIQNLYQNIKITVHEFDEVKSPSSIKHILAVAYTFAQSFPTVLTLSMCSSYQIVHLVAMDTCQPGLLTCSKHHTLYGHVYKVVAFSWRGIDLAKTGNQLIIKSYKAVVRDQC